MYMSLCSSLPPPTGALKTNKARMLSPAGKRHCKGGKQGAQSVCAPEFCTQSPTNQPGSIFTVCRSVFHAANPRVLSCHLEYATSRSVQLRCCKPATSQAGQPGPASSHGLFLLSHTCSLTHKMYPVKGSHPLGEVSWK